MPIFSRVFALAHLGACLSIVLLTGLIVLQIAGRIVDAILRLIGQPPTGFIVPSLSEIAGFLFVAATFLALASTLEKGVHIRVALVVSKLGARTSRFILLAAMAFCALLFGFMAWQTGLFALDSLRFNEVSYGMIPVPLVWPQSVMAFGLALFALAFVVLMARVVRRRPTPFDETGDAPTTSGAD